jgi:hypothetical protein
MSFVGCGFNPMLNWKGFKESKKLIDWRKGFQKPHKLKTSFSSPSLFLSSSKHKN